MKSVALLALALPLAFARPHVKPRWYDSPVKSVAELLSGSGCNCPTGSIDIPVPGNITVPEGEELSMVTVGRGIQNYTCSSGKWTSIGAVANLFDVSCLVDYTGYFVDTETVSEYLPQIVFEGVNFPDTENLPVKVHHFFTHTPGSDSPSAISPEFASDSDYVIASVVLKENAQNATRDVQELQLAAVAGEGTLAKSVYRLNTFRGQPPSSCDQEGAQTSIQYAAMYYFTK